MLAGAHLAEAENREEVVVEMERRVVPFLEARLAEENGGAPVGLAEVIADVALEQGEVLRIVGIIGDEQFGEDPAEGGVAI